MILDKIPLEQIEKWLGLPFETIKRIADEMS
jgi:hypothetical protein